MEYKTPWALVGAETEHGSDGDDLLTIDANDVPMDSSLDNVERCVRPRDWSGVVVKFPISRSYGATLRLVDEQHRPITLGSQVTLNRTGAQGIVGYDGLTFFDGPDAPGKEIMKPDNIDQQFICVVVN